VKWVENKKLAPNVRTPKRLQQTVTNIRPPIEEIADLDNLPLDECMELTRRLLTALPNPPQGQLDPEPS
jgi:hypothetical protein